MAETTQEFKDLKEADLKEIYAKEVGQEAPKFLSTKEALIYGIEQHRAVKAAQQPVADTTDHGDDILAVHEETGEERYFTQQTWEKMSGQQYPWREKAAKPSEEI